MKWFFPSIIPQRIQSLLQAVAQHGQALKAWLREFVGNLLAGNRLDIPCWSGLQILLHSFEQDPGDLHAGRLQRALQAQGMVGIKRYFSRFGNPPPPLSNPGQLFLPRQQLVMDEWLQQQGAHILVTGRVDDENGGVWLKIIGISPQFLPANRLQALPAVNFATLTGQLFVPLGFSLTWIQLLNLLLMAAAPADWQFPDDWDVMEPFMRSADDMRDSASQGGDDDAWYGVELSIGRISMLRGQAYRGQRWLLRTVSACEEGLKHAIPLEQFFLRACLSAQLAKAALNLHQLNAEQAWLDQAWQAINQAIDLLSTPLLRHETATLELQRAEILWEQHQLGKMGAMVAQQPARLNKCLEGWRQYPTHRPTLLAGLGWLAQFEKACAGFARQARLRSIHLQNAADAEAELATLQALPPHGSPPSRR